MDEKTNINMEFVDPIDDEKQGETLPTETPKNEVTEKEPGKVRKFFRTITTPVRYVGRKLKESPAAGAIGMVLGAGAALGGKALIDHFGRRGSGEGFIPADTPEIEVPDLGEETIDVPTYDTTD